MKLTLEQIARWMAAESLALPQGANSGRAGDPSAGDESIVATGYSIDSRTLRAGDLFFAIRGERFDGHDFVGAALERGACAAVVARQKQAGQAWGTQAPLLVVDDTQAALQRLAAAVRRHWGKRVIGITGSAGKTTTKDAVAMVLGERFSVLKSQGNLNNGYGLPLQLLRLEPEHEVAVIEMGMSAAGEIAGLCRIAAPDWGVVTNVGYAHAEGFADGIAGVARAKYELVAGLHPGSGVAFLNCDDAYVSQFGRDFAGKAVYFGRGPCADPRATKVERLGAEGMRADVHAGEQRCELRLRLLGEHNVLNALAAIAAGVEAGIPLADCCAVLAELGPGDKRGQVLTIRGATVINDCYNSNPGALKAMIAVLAGMPARRQILVAGEMLELGPESAALHGACGRAAAEAGIDVVVGVRGQAREIVAAARAGGSEALFVETPVEAGAWLREHLREGDAALLKASRGVRLERALEGLGEGENGTASAQAGGIR